MVIVGKRKIGKKVNSRTHNSRMTWREEESSRLGNGKKEKNEEEVMMKMRERGE